MKDLQDPIITMTERTGYPGGVPREPTCPICGGICERVYKDCSGIIFACDVCLTDSDAWDEPECFGEGGEF